MLDSDLSKEMLESATREYFNMYLPLPVFWNKGLKFCEGIGEKKKGL